MFLKYWIERLGMSLTDDLLNFMPELILCVGIVAFLVFRLFRAFDRVHLGALALLVTLTALGTSVQQWIGWDVNKHLPGVPLAQDMFSGLLSYDGLTVFLRMFLFSFTALVIWLSVLTGIPDREDSADFYTLLLGATLGMSLMASANHLLMIFIGVEMASLPSYALAGFLKGKRQGSEAALKYVVYGGGASGIMLYGISLLSGKFGTGYLPDLAAGFANVIRGGEPSLGLNFDAVVLLGTLFVLIGVGFKLAAVPFHFWCPDVFEGAAAEVAGFLSVASKGAALALLGRFALVLGGLAKATESYQVLRAHTPDYETWLHMAQYMVPALALFAAVTATFGNLAAYLQTNLKRLLAYSTIAHAGYMMMGLAAFTAEGASAVLFYLVAYLFMNLGAFAVVAFLRNRIGSEDLSAYRGLVQRSPVMVVTFGFFLFSLLGVPPLAGFAAKFQIFSVLFYGARQYAADAPNLSYILYALLVVGGINTVISVVYYIKVLKVMILDRPDEEVAGAGPRPIDVPTGSVAYAAIMAAVVLILGLAWDPLVAASDSGTERFLRLTPPRSAAAPTPKTSSGGGMMSLPPPPVGVGAGGPKGGAPKARGPAKGLGIPKGEEEKAMGKGKAKGKAEPK